MIEVTKEQFYAYINPLDITILSAWRKPIMETTFSRRCGPVVGKATTDYSDGLGVDKYYLQESLIGAPPPKE